MKNNIDRVMFMSGFLLMSSAACTIQDIKRWGYRLAREYSCENHGPNIPKRQVECMEEGMSFEEYEEARRRDIEGEE